MRIAVTGADGRIGRAVVDRALATGHEVVALDRAAEQVPRPGVARHAADVTDYHALVPHLVGCDALVHLAAITGPGHLADHVVHDHNVTGSYHALRAAAEVGITRVCQASSVNAIGGRFSREARYDYFPIDVAHPTYAEDPYSLSKWICEQQADAAARRFDMSVVSLRFHGVVPTRADALPWNEAMPDAVARQLWGYTTLESSARACIDAITTEIDGHHVCNIVAADTMTDVPTLELCEQYYPDVPIRADLSGHRGLFDTTSTTQLLGWTPDPLDTEAPA